MVSFASNVTKLTFYNCALNWLTLSYLLQHCPKLTNFEYYDSLGYEHFVAPGFEDAFSPVQSSLQELIITGEHEHSVPDPGPSLQTFTAIRAMTIRAELLLGIAYCARPPQRTSQQRSQLRVLPRCRL